MIQFIPLRYLEMAAWTPGMVVYSYGVPLPTQYGPEAKVMTEIELIIRKGLGI
jgi:hypothetical protein